MNALLHQLDKLHGELELAIKPLGGIQGILAASILQRRLAIDVEIVKLLGELLDGRTP